MVSRLIVRPTFLVAALLLITSAASAQTQLRWKLSPGQTFNQTLTQKSILSANVAGQSIDSESTLTVDNVWNINKVDSQGNAEVTQTITRVRMKMGAPTGDINIDTANAEEPTDLLGKRIGASLKALTRAKVSFDMSPLGEVSNVKVISADGGVGGADQFGQVLGKDGVVSLVKQSMQPLPADPLRKGASWTNKLEVEVPLLGKVLTDSLLTYEGTTKIDGKPLEEISVETTTAIAQKEAGNQFAKMSITEQSERGAIYFDNVAGRFSHSESTQNLTLSINLAGQMVNQKVTTVRKTTLSEVSR